MKKIIIICALLIMAVFISKIYVISKNNKYLDDIKKEILNNYELAEEIKYLNKTNSYCIILTNKYLIVLDKNYNEIKKEDAKKIEYNNKNYEIVYRLNKVMYEEKKINKDKIIYNYYDIYTNEYIDTLEIGG